jgi:hypothetical protein
MKGALVGALLAEPATNLFDLGSKRLVRSPQPASDLAHLSTEFFESCVQFGQRLLQLVALEFRVGGSNRGLYVVDRLA